MPLLDGPPPSDASHRPNTGPGDGLPGIHTLLRCEQRGRDQRTAAHCTSPSRDTASVRYSDSVFSHPSSSKNLLRQHARSLSHSYAGGGRSLGRLAPRSDLHSTPLPFLGLSSPNSSLRAHHGGMPAPLSLDQYRMSRPRSLSCDAGHARAAVPLPPRAITSDSSMWSAGLGFRPRTSAYRRVPYTWPHRPEALPMGLVPTVHGWPAHHGSLVHEVKYPAALPRHSTSMLTPLRGDGHPPSPGTDVPELVFDSSAARQADDPCTAAPAHQASHTASTKESDAAHDGLSSSSSLEDPEGSQDGDAVDDELPMTTSPVKNMRKPGKFECNFCSKRFTRPSSLRTHIHSHTGEKPYKCNAPGCGRCFSVHSNLRRHQKSHSGAPVTSRGRCTS